MWESSRFRTGTTHDEFYHWIVETLIMHISCLLYEVEEMINERVLENSCMKVSQRTSVIPEEHVLRSENDNFCTLQTSYKRRIERDLILASIGIDTPREKLPPDPAEWPVYVSWTSGSTSTKIWSINNGIRGCHLLCDLKKLEFWRPRSRQILYMMSWVCGSVVWRSCKQTFQVYFMLLTVRASSANSSHMRSEWNANNSDCSRFSHACSSCMVLWRYCSAEKVECVLRHKLNDARYHGKSHIARWIVSRLNQDVTMWGRLEAGVSRPILFNGKIPEDLNCIIWLTGPELLWGLNQIDNSKVTFHDQG